MNPEPMTAGHPPPVPFPPRGWILWLSWVYLALIALGTLLGLYWLITGMPPFGLQVRGEYKLTVWGILSWALYMGFALGVVGVLVKDRHLAWLAVYLGWLIAVIQSIQALLQLAHLRLSIPIGAFLYAAYAIGVTKLLTPSRSEVKTRGGLV